MGARQHGERARMSSATTRPRLAAAADAASWCFALSALAALLLVCSLGETSEAAAVVLRGASLSARWRPCEEIYVVAEGETLHGISDRCGDPYILERNPHVHDPDDVFPGLVLRITPSLQAVPPRPLARR